jgi:hypothetical protein
MCHPRPPRQPERGAIAVLAAVLLIAVGAFLALSLNVGHLMSVKTQYQAAFDSAALAGAMSLDGTVNGVAAARDDAVTYATRHFLDNTRVAISTSDVTAGYWDATRHRFYGSGESVLIGDTAIVLDPSTTAQYFTAVKVCADTDGGSHNSQRDVWFSPFLHGRSHVVVGATAVGISGGPCTNTGCTLPLAVPSCSLLDGAGNLACGQNITLYFNYGHDKTVALADIIQPSHNTDNNEERTQMQAGASCTNPQVDVGDVVALGNGTDFNSQVEQKMYAPRNIVCSGSPPYRFCPRREVAVVNIGTNCSAPMNQHVTVVGFARLVITGTNSTGNDASITVYLDCTATSPSPTTGCANFGYGSRRHRLVQ